MSGNPFGLSEISHYGSMQRVGGKAGGFINKKFFHPSSLRNQEKLWKAQTKEATEQREQAQMEKQRDEERAVEALRKQMYLQGQSTASAYQAAGIASGCDASPVGAEQQKEQKDAHAEFKRRKAAVKYHQQQLEKAGAQGAEEEAAEGEASPKAEHEEDLGIEQQEQASLTSASATSAPSKPLAKSVYREDVHAHGHESVWGSWFCREAQRWGFTCCKGLKRKERCPLAPQEPISQVKQPVLVEKSERASKRQRRTANKAAARLREAQEAKAAKAEPSEAAATTIEAAPSDAGAGESTSGGTAGSPSQTTEAASAIAAYASSAAAVTELAARAPSEGSSSRISPSRAS